MENEEIKYDKIQGDYSLEEQIDQVKKHNDPKMVPEILKNDPVDMIAGGEGEFGKIATNPIPVNGVHGERVYLSFLFCKTCREPLLFHRHGSMWMKINDEPVCVDDYEVCCYTGCTREHLYLAPYYPKRSMYVPEGYIAQVLDYKTTPFFRFLIDWPNSLGTNKYIHTFPYGLEEFITFYFTELIGNPSMTRMRLEKYKEVTDSLRRQGII